MVSAAFVLSYIISLDSILFCVSFISFLLDSISRIIRIFTLGVIFEIVSFPSSSPTHRSRRACLVLVRIGKGARCMFLVLRFLVVLEEDVGIVRCV